MEELIAQQCELIGQLQAEAEETAKSHRDAIEDWRERSLALKDAARSVVFTLTGTERPRRDECGFPELYDLAEALELVDD